MSKTIGMIFLTVVIMLMAFSCAGPESGQPLLTAELPLHLEEHLDDARIEGSEVPDDLPSPVEWRFDEPQPAWRVAVPINQTTQPAKITLTEDVLRLVLTEANDNTADSLVGGVYIDLPDWVREDWGYVLLMARTSDKFGEASLGFNLTKSTGSRVRWPYPFLAGSQGVPLICDGSIQTYLLPVDKISGRWKGPWKELGLWFEAPEPGEIDILSVSVIPKEALYAGESAGVRTIERNDAFHRALYMHVPGKLEYRIKIPEAASLDVGLGVLWDEPVTFRIKAGLKDNETQTLLEKTCSNSKIWDQCRVDLSSFEGKTINISLEADAERMGTVAFWSAPTLTGMRTTRNPNIIFYVIDAAGADFMSLYGYERPTTPNMEKLAAEGAVFENAYSNSSWTKPSVPSFMTSLHHSVLGGYKNLQDQIPEQVSTMAQHFHRGRYQTAVITSTVFCGMMSSLHRGVDMLSEKGVWPYSRSSKYLHEIFWDWREKFPGEPYWVHFQTTDVHAPYFPSAPFAGLYVDKELKNTFYRWWTGLNKEKIPEASTLSSYIIQRLNALGIDRLTFFDVLRGLYDETMTHQDHRLGQLMERLKDEGEWENTLLIIASDHGHPAASYPRWGRGLLDSLPPDWEGAILGSYKTRIPLIFIWPGHIVGGQRIKQPVSMIDILPTVLDLTGLPEPELMQGQSLAPLLLGKKGWRDRPVIFDEFYFDEETEGLVGNIEVIDGRWGASLEIVTVPRENSQYPNRCYQAPASGRWKYPPHDVPDIPRLLLYDLEKDPLALRNVNEEYPDLVKKYTIFLEKKWKDHRELAKSFSGKKKGALTSEQIRTLRSLGYIK